ncbi:hypothetical protein BT67DRAFT_444470 [Trichocladium antarcticum]|uniref:Chromo domain-containing protein n=1 Tax=Trichocladium antarcticum TaxID=1450529 RepID=A0AAN6UEX3_9PEZI|nr:hypothetical protein BT67DRAFT_444470 [Trichocladium antarcticum]
MIGLPSTFALEFDWDPCAEHGAEYRGSENGGTISSAKRYRPARQKSKGSAKDKDKPTSTSRRTRHTPADDAKIRQLKEQGLSWIAIAKHFPGRSARAIEVRYHTKLKTTNLSQRGAPQLCDSPRTPSVVDDDTSEEEWEVEGICGDRRLGDGGLELLVKWKGGEETWEPYENVAET